MSSPAVRATLVRMLRRRALELWPEDAAALDAALGPEGCERLARTAGYDWIPFEDELAISRAVHARHGEEGVRRLGIELAPVGRTHPLLRPAISATLGMLGRRPAAVVSSVAAVWAIGTRNAGRLAAGAASARQVYLSHPDLPPLLRDRAWLVRVGGLAEGILQMIGLETELTVEWEPGAASARMLVTWRRPG